MSVLNAGTLSARAPLGDPLAAAWARRVLVVGDAPGRLDGLRRLLRPREGQGRAGMLPCYEVDGAPEGEEALRMATRALQAGRPYAVAFVDGWRRDPALAHLRVAVNVSPRQVMHGGLAGAFAAVVGEEGIEPGAIDLEITEPVLHDADAARLRDLAELRRMGMRLHLDDFGTGHSSLGYLGRLTVDALKIDRSFVGALDTDPAAEPIVRAIVSLAHTFGMRVVAEGVETEAQRARLRRMGCDLGQGYLFARPVDGDEIPALLRGSCRPP